MASFQVPFSRGNFGPPKLESEDHEELAERLRKTLYYGQHPKSDRPSLPLTEAAIEFFQEAAPRKLGRIDPDFAAATVRQACVSPSSVMMGMMYTKRLRHRNPDYLQQITSSDLFLISMMMASKYLYDEGTDDEIFNDEWAASADLETEEINEMERNFLSAIDWNLFIHRKEFESVLHEIEKRIALRQGNERESFTYTDLWVLLHDRHLILISRQVAGEITKVFLVTSLAYIAGILTMVGSTLLVTGAVTALSPLMLTASSVVQPIPEVPKVVLPGHQDSLTSRRSWSVSAVISQLLTLVSIPSLLTISRSTDQVSLDEARRRNHSCSPKDQDVESESILLDQTPVSISSEQQPHCHITGNSMTSATTATLYESPASDTNVKQRSGVGLAYTVLLTIQDMLAHYADRISKFDETKKSESGSNRNMERVCAEGPCIQSSNRHCWNVTFAVRKGMIDQCRECAKTAANRNRNCQTNKETEQIKCRHQQRCSNSALQYGGIHSFRVGPGKGGHGRSCCESSARRGQGHSDWETSRSRLYDENQLTRCCCEEPLSATVDRGGGFLDVSLGFHTQHSVFVTY